MYALLPFLDSKGRHQLMELTFKQSGFWLFLGVCAPGNVPFMPLNGACEWTTNAPRMKKQTIAYFLLCEPELIVVQ